jgi:hypothetical protein
VPKVAAIERLIEPPDSESKLALRAHAHALVPEKIKKLVKFDDGNYCSRPPNAHIPRVPFLIRFVVSPHNVILKFVIWTCQLHLVDFCCVCICVCNMMNLII